MCGKLLWLYDTFDIEFTSSACHVKMKHQQIFLFYCYNSMPAGYFHRHDPVDVSLILYMLSPSIYVFFGWWPLMHFWKNLTINIAMQLGYYTCNVSDGNFRLLLHTGVVDCHLQCIASTLQCCNEQCALFAYSLKASSSWILNGVYIFVIKMI